VNEERGTCLDEATTCRMYVKPRLAQVGWYDTPHDVVEQKAFTDGRIVAVGRNVKRRPEKRSDYLLMYQNDLPLAVVEAKAAYKLPEDGLQQGKEYAEILGLKFAYATNGHSIVEYDYTTGQEHILDAFPTPDELWVRLRTYEGLLDESVAQKLLSPSYPGDKEPRYYQQIAIHRTIQAVLTGRKRTLLTMATGTGKTFVAFQICWKLWNAYWKLDSRPRKTRILYLADRNVLVDQPKDNIFTPFGEARHKIEHGDTSKSREMYFAIYQALADHDNNPGFYKDYPRDFFDLIIVDECHRGSVNEQGSWRDILDYFAPAYQIGMTATPKRDDNVDTYTYFGNPLYTYSLRQGIEDGFLAPYHVHRIVTDYDALGWRPGQGDLDRYGRAIPDEEYQTRDFERVVALRTRTEAIAHHLTEFLKRTDRFAKTIVFCVDQEHANEMRRAINNLNTDLTRNHPNYVCRVTSNEGDVGLYHLSNFQEVEPGPNAPVILTTSQMLTTGVDIPTCQNIVLARVVNSITEFKQIIGRGTRVRADYNKYYFNILDYTGSATHLFADPAFDGDPVLATEEQIDRDGEIVDGSQKTDRDVAPDDKTFLGADAIEDELPSSAIFEGLKERHGKYYFDGGKVSILGDQVYELDADDHVLRMVKLTDYTASKVRTMYPNAATLRNEWANPERRKELTAYFENRGISFDELAHTIHRPDTDPFDILCYVAFSMPLRTRRERANRVLREQQAFFARYSDTARAILQDLLETYTEHGPKEFVFPKLLNLPPYNHYGNVREIVDLFGGSDHFRASVDTLQTLLYTDAA